MRTGRDVAIFVHRDRELLLLKRARQGIWHIPAGVVEAGETYLEAGVRELAEETGLSASTLIDLSFSQRYPPAADQVTEYSQGVSEVTLENFATEAPQGWEPTLNEEHTEYRWCSFEDASGMLHWPDTRRALAVLRERLDASYA